MNQTITVSEKTIEEIFARLDMLTREIKTIKVKFFEKEPPYGSRKWWKWSEKKADEDIKEGNTIEFNSVEEAVKWLNS